MVTSTETETVRHPAQPVLARGIYAREDRKLGVYVAAPYIYKTLAHEQGLKLTDAGFTVTSTWHETRTPDYDVKAPTDYGMLIAANRDEFDLDSADILVYNAEEAVMGSGRHFEFGWARRAGTRIIAIRGGMFTRLHGVENVDSFDQALEVLKRE